MWQILNGLISPLLDWFVAAPSPAAGSQLSVALAVAMQVPRLQQPMTAVLQHSPHHAHLQTEVAATSMLLISEHTVATVPPPPAQQGLSSTHSAAIQTYPQSAATIDAMDAVSSSSATRRLAASHYYSHTSNTYTTLYPP